MHIIIFIVEGLFFILGLLNLLGMCIILRDYVNHDCYPISWKGWIGPLVCECIAIILMCIYFPCLKFTAQLGFEGHPKLMFPYPITMLIGFISSCTSLLLFIGHKIERFIGSGAEITQVVEQDSFIVPPPDHVGDMTCVVCNENESVRATYYVCGHYFACESCFYEFTMSNHEICPRCRKCRIY